ncbi:MAG: endolytic transglycosylase MltG [Thermoanaerobaculia bacterium]|nr:MAG: endolytic transglycosylase MltG [Thermoanaerobaculia bacterium]MBZ0101695.1 endolytic transglycosylase MltG [Thermoanaerobaculia bacterium]
MKRWLLRLAGLLVLAAVVAAGAVRLAQRELVRPRQFTAVDLEVAPGQSARTVLEQLERDGVVGSALLARLWLGRVRGDPAIHAGEYRFEPPLSAVDAIEMLVRGDVVTHPVTIVEGLTLHETAAALAAAGFGDRERFIAEFSAPGRIADLDPQATHLEGYLQPDTYRFARGTGEAAIADALVAAFRARFEREIRPLLAGAPLATPRELVILASLVEKEARREEERPLIAAVYANRLARGIGLYADPTIIYGLKLEGRWDGNLRRRDLEADSPWNTYRVAGLPPGPICSPGLASLRAAARPAEVPWLYFVSRNDGTHVFSATLTEHNRNVEIWQRQYFRQRRAAAGGDGRAH